MQGRVDSRSANTSAHSSKSRPRPEAAGDAISCVPSPTMRARGTGQDKADLPPAIHPDSSRSLPTASAPNLVGNEAAAVDAHSASAFFDLLTEVAQQAWQMPSGPDSTSIPDLDEDSSVPSAFQVARRGIRVDMARIAAISKDPIAEPHRSHELQVRLQSLQGLISREPASVLTILAMEMSALIAFQGRGHAIGAAIHQMLFDCAATKVPESQRLEALVVYRSMLGVDRQQPLLNDCNLAIKKKYTQLKAPDKEKRLLAWSEMNWWHESIGGFHGHTGPLRLTAVTGMLAVLGPRLCGHSLSTNMQCLNRLMARIHPLPAELPPAGPLDLGPWDDCLAAWSACAAKLNPVELAGLMHSALMPLLGEAEELWPHQAEILLEALARSLDRLEEHARHQTASEMGEWFGVLVEKAQALPTSQARLAVSLSMKMLRLVQALQETWAANLSRDLRRLINSDPRDIGCESDLNPDFPEADCKTQ